MRLLVQEWQVTWLVPVTHRNCTPPCQWRWWSTVLHHWEYLWCVAVDTEWLDIELFCPELNTDTFSLYPLVGMSICGAEILDHLHQELPSVCQLYEWQVLVEPYQLYNIQVLQWTRSGYNHLSPGQEIINIGIEVNKEFVTLKFSPSSSSSPRRWIVKLPHWVLLAWNLPLSTWRYLVLEIIFQWLVWLIS